MSAEPPKLILVNGQPGTGKTTLKKRLATDLKIPTIGKDDIKELLFDTLGVGDAEWSTLLGRVSVDMLNSATETLLSRGNDLIVESAFIYSFAHADLEAIIEKTKAQVLEVYCETSGEVRRQRFDERISSGDRHAGHNDAINALSDEDMVERYAPLELGQIVHIDTTDFGDKAYAELLAQVQAFLTERA